MVRRARKQFLTFFIQMRIRRGKVWICKTRAGWLEIIKSGSTTDCRFVRSVRALVRIVLSTRPNDRYMQPQQTNSVYKQTEKNLDLDTSFGELATLTVLKLLTFAP